MIWNRIEWQSWGEDWDFRLYYGRILVEDNLGMLDLYYYQIAP